MGRKEKTAVTEGTGFKAGRVSLSDTDGWCADSGAFAHMTRHKDWFSDLSPIDPVPVNFGNDHVANAVGIGKIPVQVFHGTLWADSFLNNVYYVPELGSTNLFSLGTQKWIHCYIGRRLTQDIGQKQKTCYCWIQEGWF